MTSHKRQQPYVINRRSPGFGTVSVIHRKTGTHAGLVNRYTRGGFMAMTPLGFQRSFSTQKAASFWLLRLYYQRERARKSQEG